MLEGASSTVSIAELQKKALEKRSSFTLPPDRNGHWEVDGGNLVLKEDEASAQQYALKRDFMMSLRSADVKKVSSSDEMLERLRVDSDLVASPAKHPTGGTSATRTSADSSADSSASRSAAGAAPPMPPRLPRPAPRGAPAKGTSQPSSPRAPPPGLPPRHQVWADEVSPTRVAPEAARNGGGAADSPGRLHENFFVRRDSMHREASPRASPALTPPPRLKLACAQRTS